MAYEEFTDDEFIDRFGAHPSLSDDDLVTAAKRLATIGGMQDELHDCFEELLRRYNKKKKECQELEDELKVERGGVDGPYDGV